ncbi:VCBS repeat-containing protein [Kerstersia gyiorum]|uniref:VCBS repeat-containing protein n=4 Tax=Kerstersia gyiorum TaxID=206506 RepID=A0A4Q7MTM5_9BURK|nr:Ig-like domain-containing protein [Kerstersia gyiorum]RZS70302.1 VCBS repeat-containing protein [Kerstersia gyiorum]
MPTVADEIGNFPGSNISLVEPSIVKLPISPELVTAYEKSGNNLILKLENGKNVSVLDFFKVAEDGTRSELVLEAADGTQYWGQYEQPWSEFSFTQIDETERNALAEAEAEAAARGDSAAPVELTGGAAEHDFNWLVGAFAVLAGAGIAIFRDSLSSSGSSGEPSDNEAPGAPTDVGFADDGKTLVGKGEPGATVNVKDQDGNPVLDANGDPITGKVDDDGNFSVVIEPPPAAGTEFDVTLTDGAGNESDPTKVVAPGEPTNPDTEAPEAPTDVAFAEDGKTLTGKGEAGATVVLKDKDGNPVLGADGQPVTGQVGADGSFSVVVEPAPAAGTEIQVSLKDAAGNESDATTVTAPGTPTNPDTEAPAAPTDVAFAEDGKTLTGKGEAGATVVLKDKDGNPVLGADGQPVTGQVGADGSFSVVVEPAPAAGTEIQVSLKDAAGNESDATTVTAPGTPTNPDTEAPAAPTDVAFAEDGKTLTGKGEAGATVVLKDKDGNPVLGADGQPVTGQVGADGSFSVVVEPAPAAGTEIQVSLKDAAGNESDATTVTAPGTPTNPDTEAPAAPTDVAFAEDGKTLTGKGEAGATVVLKDKDGNPMLGADGQPVTGQVGADGSFSVVVEPAPAAGTEIQVSLKDAAGNESDATTVTAPGTPTNPDTEAPAAPTDVAFAEDGKTLTGKGETGATVVLKDKDGNPVLGADGQPVTGQVGADGSFSVVVEPAPAAGTEIQVSLKDAAGNESDATTVTAPGTPTNPDTEAPAAPTDVAFAEDGKTLTGKGEAGATVVLKDKDGNLVKDANGQVVTAQVGANGEFAVVFEPAPAAGTEFHVSLKDAAGNESDPASVTAPGTPTNPDTEAPDAPTDVAFLPDGKTLTGKGEAGATVILKDKDGNAVQDGNGHDLTGKVDADGNFVVVFNAPPAAGTEFKVSLQDEAGNESDPASAVAPGEPARIQANDDAQDASMAIAVGPKNVSSDSAYAKSDLSLNLLKVGLNKVLGVDLLDLNLLTGTSSFDINVGSGQTHTVGFKVKAGGVLGLLTTVSVHIYYELPDGQWAPYQSFKDKFIGINLLGLSPSVKIDGVVLPEGKYKVLVEETGGISLLETIKVSTTSYLVTDINTAGPDDIKVEAVSGNVMQDDATYDSTRLNTVNGKAVAADGSTEIEGQYGVLTVHADGSYSYQAFADTANVGKSDVFVYEIYDADRNQSSQAKLTIDIKGEVVEPAAAKAAVFEHDVTDDAGAADVVADQADDADEGHEGGSQDAVSQGEDGSLVLDLLQAAETQQADTPAADAGTPLLSDSGIDLDGLLQDTPAAAGGVADGVEEAFAAPVAATATPENGIDDAIAAGPASVSLDDLLQQNALVY